MPPLRWAAIAVAAGTVALTLVAVDAGGAPRAVAALTFVAVSGLALAPLLPARSPLAFAAATAAASLALTTLSATAVLAAGRFSPAAALAVLLGACLAGCAAQAIRRLRRARITEIHLRG